MSYRIAFGGGSGAQFHDLPKPTQDALISRAVDLIEAPWDGTRMLAGGDPAFREATFDEGRGLVDIYVDEAAEVIQIFTVVWMA